MSSQIFHIRNKLWAYLPVTEKFSLSVCELCDRAGLVMSSNEREGLCGLSPPTMGVRRRRQSRVSLEAESALIFVLVFLCKDGRHDHVKTSHRPVFKAQMFTDEPGSLVLTLKWIRYGERRN